MIHVHAEAEKNISSAAAVSRWRKQIDLEKERGDEKVVELDQFKSILSAYKEPLVEMRDSL